MIHVDRYSGPNKNKLFNATDWNLSFYSMRQVLARIVVICFNNYTGLKSWKSYGENRLKFDEIFQAFDEIASIFSSL